MGAAPTCGRHSSCSIGSSSSGVTTSRVLLLSDEGWVELEPDGSVDELESGMEEELEDDEELEELDELEEPGGVVTVGVSGGPVVGLESGVPGVNSSTPSGRSGLPHLQRVTGSPPPGTVVAGPVVLGKLSSTTVVDGEPGVVGDSGVLLEGGSVIDDG